jgi:outer membrane murein-binding lipoprotein Lpp
VRFRLLRRRLTISAPRMAVRSAMPWPLRWAVAAIMLGFCAAIALWAFEFGRDIAGLENGGQADMQQLRAQVEALKTDLDKAHEQRDQAQSIANTAGTLVAAEKASSERVSAQVKHLEAENRRLRDDLGFFEKLIPADSTDAVAIRGLQAETVDNGKIRWQVLVIQSKKNAPELVGKLEIMLTGLSNGKPWTGSVSTMPLKIMQYGRLEGSLDIPAQVTVKGLTAKVVDGSTVRAGQSIKL